MEGRRARGDEGIESWHLVGVRETVADVGVEAHPQLLGGGDQGHERVPGAGSGRRPWPEAHVPFPYPAPRPQLGRVVV